MATKKAARIPSLARPLPAGKTVSGSAFALLFNELFSYHSSRSFNVTDLETRIISAGIPIGARFLELVSFRDRPGKRDLTQAQILQFMAGVFWLHVFGKAADLLERDKEQENQLSPLERYADMLWDFEPLLTYFIQPPKEVTFNCSCFMAGILQGALQAAGFPNKVSTLRADGEGPRDKVVFVIKFENSTAK